MFIASGGILELYTVPNFKGLVAACDSLRPRFGEWSFREDRMGIATNCKTVPFYWLENFKLPDIDLVEKFDGIPPEVATAIKDLEDYYGGFVCKAMLVTLKAGGDIPRHTDIGIDFEESHRCHIPIYCNDDCIFYAKDKWYSLTEGVAYELSNLDEHEVLNLGVEERLHLVIDISKKGI